MKNCSMPFNRPKKAVLRDKRPKYKPEDVLRNARQAETKLEIMRCERCTGLVVADHFIGGGASIGGWAYGGWRCVNCGAIGLSGHTDTTPLVRSVARQKNGPAKSRAPNTAASAMNSHRIIEKRTAR